jgi:hypothetical protein
MTNTNGRFVANNLMPAEYRVYAGPGESQKLELKSIH